MSDLSGAMLNGATMSAVDIRDANGQATGRLWSANLVGANLRGADLSGAQLKDADMQGADLSGARLQGTVLMGAKYQEAIIDLEQLARAIINPGRRSKN